jgi:hypothetical protein
MTSNSASELTRITRPLSAPIRASGLAERLWQNISGSIAAIAGHLRESALDKIERRLPPAAPPYHRLHSDVLRAETRRLL